MRVHQVINSHSESSGGAEKLVRCLHAELRNRRWDSRLVELVESGTPPSAAVSLRAKAPYGITAWARLRAYLRREVMAGDIVHAHLSPCLFFCAYGPRPKGGNFHFLATEHHVHNNRRGHLLGWAIDRLTYPRMERIVCISKGVENSLNRWMPLTRGKTVVIPNGSIPVCNLFFERPVRCRLRLLSVGRMHPCKNVANVLRALACLEGDWEYHHAGSGPLENELKRLTVRLGLADRVYFHGQVADVKPLFRQADIFLNPSFSEGFGLAALEAMSSGLPVIASDIPGLRELQDAAQPCLLLVDPGAPVSILGAVRQLTGSKSRRLELGRCAQERAKSFTLERMVAAHTDLYQELSSQG